MIETITPAVCGSRKRRRIALAAFAVAAVATSAVVGATLGLVGAAVGRSQALVAAAVLATLAAARELGLVRVPLPQARLQVPERWRRERPLVVWAGGYGAGLGAGFATYQPVATFWVACAAALALARPAAAAACFALYGAGRALMVALPGSREGDPAAAAERLVRRRPVLVRANAAALAAAAVALALAPAAGAEPLYLGPGNQLDPAPSNGVLAYTQREFDASSVVVRVSAAEQVVVPGSWSPSLDGGVLAVEDGAGVRVVRWRSGADVARVADASRPALDWPWLAYRIDAFDGARELWLANLVSGETRLVTRVRTRTDIGRPSLAAGRLAWHAAGANGSVIRLYTIKTQARGIVARSKIALLAYPSLTDARIVWVERRSGVSSLRLRLLAERRVVTLARTYDRDEVFWTTALAGRYAYVTRWFTSAGIAYLERIRF